MALGPARLRRTLDRLRRLPPPAERTRGKPPYDAPASQLPVQGRIVAVLTDTSTDNEGYTSTGHTPVITFTTHEGTTVTAYPVMFSAVLQEGRWPPGPV
ncbi:hypothetical protein OG226_45080 [Streptomyces sp. NBC_01261]|uniref:hypothetical protein n=1 Tax=Streptomyces sp. NBC_01261 TaxID=2903802 RepID=UPI002E376394|nr:hypothetical protein [Streptomyces sp. NBC_01261]